MILAAAIAVLAVAVLTLWQARSLLAAAKEIRRESDRNIAAIIATSGVERDRLLDRIADYDGKPRFQVTPIGETHEPLYDEGTTQNVESIVTVNGE